MKISSIIKAALLVIVPFIVFSYMDAHACSRILWGPEGQPVLVGRNMDWTERMGTQLYAMPRGIERQGMTTTNPMKWTSKYGSIVAAVWNAATADGMNEAGLVANLLYLAETKYGDRDAALGGISVSVWAQYYLDNFATVAQAVEAAKSVQVRPFGLTHHGQPFQGSTISFFFSREFGQSKHAEYFYYLFVSVGVFSAPEGVFEICIISFLLQVFLI